MDEWMDEWICEQKENFFLLSFVSFVNHSNEKKNSKKTQIEINK